MKLSASHIPFEGPVAARWICSWFHVSRPIVSELKTRTNGDVCHRRFFRTLYHLHYVGCIIMQLKMFSQLNCEKSGKSRR